MALKITKASEPITVERLNVVIYAVPGIGKTSLAYTAESPLLLDFDSGAYRASSRGDTVQVSEWSDVANMTADDLAPYSTIIVDTAGRALDVLAADIIKRNPKHGNGGSLSLQGFGQLKARFAAFMKLLNSFGKDVVLVVHMDEKTDGDDIIERLDMQGASKNEVYKVADMMGRIRLVGHDRIIDFNPTAKGFGKNPGQLEPVKIPHCDAPEYAGTLARIIAATKERLNSLTEAQREAIEEQEWMRTALAGAEDADAINALVQRAKDGGRATTALLVARAKEIGLVANKETKQYEAPAAEPAEEAEAA